MDGFAEGLHLYWAWEVDDIEDRIIFQILEWRNDIAQSRGKEKKSNSTGHLRMTTLHIRGAQEGRRRLREKTACKILQRTSPWSLDLLPDRHG